jgi:polysaccharide biosynthesis PFTS motif protein
LWDELSPSIDTIFACKSLSPLASISIPYTSTAYISNTYNIPTIYLDPTQMLDSDFKINNGIPLASSKEELFKWYESINKKEYQN